MYIPLQNLLKLISFLMQKLTPASANSFFYKSLFSLKPFLSFAKAHFCLSQSFCFAIADLCLSLFLLQKLISA